MTLPMTRRLARQACGVVSVAVLAACGGGGLVALLKIVTPLAGQWDTKAGDEGISFDTTNLEDQVFLSKLDVSANVRSVSGVCGAPDNASVAVQGTLDNGKLSLRVPGATSACIEGTFTDLRRLDVVALGGASARSYYNSRVDVQMNTGLWVSDGGQLKLKFISPSTVDNDSNDVDNVTGCDVSNTAAKVSFTGTMKGFVTATLTRPTIAELRDSGNALLFSQVEFVDGATLQLRNAAGQSLTLTRQVDPVPNNGTTCL